VGARTVQLDIALQPNSALLTDAYLTLRVSFGAANRGR